MTEEECPRCNGTGTVKVFDGAALRRWRRAKDWTLFGLALEAGISLPYLSEIERGRKQPSEQVALRLEGIMAS